jgi:hypothetical protein
MRLTDDEFFDRCAIAIVGSLVNNPLCRTWEYQSIADHSFQIAEAMLNERKERVAKSHGKQED